MLVEWVKQRFALCTRKVGAWHFEKTFKTWHGSRYCAQCWQQEMTFLPTSTRAWRNEVTGDVGRERAGDAVHVTRIEGLRELFVEVLGQREQARRPRRRARQ